MEYISDGCSDEVQALFGALFHVWAKVDSKSVVPSLPDSKTSNFVVPFLLSSSSVPLVANPLNDVKLGKMNVWSYRGCVGKCKMCWLLFFPLVPLEFRLLQCVFDLFDSSVTQCAEATEARKQLVIYLIFYFFQFVLIACLRIIKKKHCDDRFVSCNIHTQSIVLSMVQKAITLRPMLLGTFPLLLLIFILFYLKSILQLLKIKIREKFMRM